MGATNPSAKPPTYFLITPARNEELNIRKTIESVLLQTVRPTGWILVNDGSTDSTGAILDSIADRTDWIQVIHRPIRTNRTPGAGVVSAFLDGVKLLPEGDWDFLVKLDADLVLPPNYFELCFRHFAQDPKLGISGGSVWSLINNQLINDGVGDPRFHVRGATKIYRRQCWMSIGGLQPITGWDTLDEIIANMHGWNTYTLPELRITQLRTTGGADGTWRNWFKNGRANYNVGYHPLFMVLKCARRLFRRPYGTAAAALAAGYATAFIQRVPMAVDPEVVRYLRDQQLRFLSFRPSLWRAS